MLSAFRMESKVWASNIPYPPRSKKLMKLIALEAAIMELTLLAEQQSFADAGDNARTTLDRIAESAGFTKQGFARLKLKEKD